MSEENPVTEMTTDECWQMLAEHEFGRVAFHLGREVHLTPINYAVHGRTLLFRTAPGSKLVGVEMNPDVVFEIDEYDEKHARSVIVRGTARRLDEDQLYRAEEVPLRPWVDTPKYEVVEIRPDEITGRAFELSRPWLHLIPQD
jgi:nitroimidazol reductase NimA-like FMN-containing flavoprotein (pyridoxamine 5'-phosphate oxidase superfamily)